MRPQECLLEESEEGKATTELYRKFQGILNKLTPQKFQALAEKSLELEINTEDRLRGCIDKIFRKVLLRCARACLLGFVCVCVCVCTGTGGAQLQHCLREPV